MIRMSKQQLAAATPQQWRNWLRDSLISFTQNDDPAEQVRSFLPLDVSSTDRNAAGSLSDEIDNLLGGRTSIAAEAAGRVLNTWSLQLDGASGAVIALNVSTQLNAPNLIAACLRLINQQFLLSLSEQDALTWASIRAFSNRASTTQIVRLGRAITAAKLWSPSLVAEYGVVLAGNDMRALPRKMLDAIPMLTAEPHTGQYAAELARGLRLQFGSDEMKAAFSTNLKDTEDVSRFRRELLEELRLDADAFALRGQIDPKAVRDVIDKAARKDKKVNEPAGGVEIEFELAARHRAMMETLGSPGTLH